MSRPCRAEADGQGQAHHQYVSAWGEGARARCSPPVASKRGDQVNARAIELARSIAVNVCPGMTVPEMNYEHLPKPAQEMFSQMVIDRASFRRTIWRRPPVSRLARGVINHRPGAQRDRGQVMM
jgi:hypothetical protein